MKAHLGEIPRNPPVSKLDESIFSPALLGSLLTSTGALLAATTRIVLFEDRFGMVRRSPRFSAGGGADANASGATSAPDGGSDLDFEFDRQILPSSDGNSETASPSDHENARANALDVALGAAPSTAKAMA